ncbi:hypothetical protein, partial [Salmonella sp. s51090]|uniref:hypothetical protein n=1 Tax=Salmonella sp. s51090 TaxID=3159651 RepID=UPI003980DB73
MGVWLDGILPSYWYVVIGLTYDHGMNIFTYDYTDANPDYPHIPTDLQDYTHILLYDDNVIEGSNVNPGTFSLYACKMPTTGHTNFKDLYFD